MQSISSHFLKSMVLAVVVLLPCLQAAQAEEPQPEASRQLLLRKEVTLPSNQAQTNLIRVKFPSGYKTPLHTHDGPGPRYVLKGKLRVEDHGERQVYGPGDVFWETGQAMTVENVGGSDAELVIFELAPVK